MTKLIDISLGVLVRVFAILCMLARLPDYLHELGGLGRDI
jgi:hypothetical protein